MGRRSRNKDRASEPRAEQGRSGRPKRVRRIFFAFLKGFLVLGVLGLVSVSFVSIYGYLVTTPYLKLQRVEMTGLDARFMHELVDRCRLSSEISLISLRLDHLKADMEKHPWVRSVSLERRFPNTLVVTAEQQEPSALVLMGKLYYMNRQGEIFKEVEASDPIDFPVVTGVSEDKQALESQLKLTARVLRRLEREKGPWSEKDLVEIHLREHGGLSLYFSHLAAEIRLSDGELGNKINGLKKVAEHLRKTGRIRQVTGIDLDYEDGAVVSFGKG
jgi:cell division protein FtsQ